MLIASVATAVAWLLAPPHRMLVPAVALAVVFVALWATGHGPWFHTTSGGVVRVLYSVMLAVSVVLVVIVPLMALWIQNGARQRGAYAPKPVAAPQLPPVRQKPAPGPRPRPSR
jgi:uncharacterized membrane protein YozB (DUF420 family)